MKQINERDRGKDGMVFFSLISTKYDVSKRNIENENQFVSRGLKQEKY